MPDHYLCPHLKLGKHSTIDFENSLHSSIGSPTAFTSTRVSMHQNVSNFGNLPGMVHFNSNAFAKTILKMLWMLMENAVLQKIKGALIAFANLRACFVMSSCSCVGNAENMSNLVPIRKGIAVYKAM